MQDMPVMGTEVDFKKDRSKGNFGRHSEEDM